MEEPIVIEAGFPYETWDVCKELEGAPSTRIVLNVPSNTCLHNDYDWSLIYKCAYIMGKGVSVICSDSQICDNEADIIMLLVSPSFMCSDYCYSVEMKKAMERHNSNKAKVIPVILRPVYWEKAPFRRIQALPTDAKPITSWTSLDEAFLDVVQGIIRTIEDSEKQKK